MPLFACSAGLRIIDSVAIALSQGLQLARARLASAPSPVLRMMAERDEALQQLARARRELEVFRGQRQAMRSHRRPEFGPPQRLEILQLMRLRAWSVAAVAQRFVLHPNTVRSWIKAVEGRGNDRLLSDAVAWNRIDEAVRWASHELRRLCPEPEFGSRTLARHLVRAGIAISRTTVQRVLREPMPPRPRPQRPAPGVAAGIKPRHLLRPTRPHQVWHLDLTTLRVLWLRFPVAAILDGFSRKLVALRVYPHTPRAMQMAALIRGAAKEHGRPHVVITDHGPQFRKRFGNIIKRMGARHVRGRVRHPFLNGKVERLFRSLRDWWRLMLPSLTAGGLQSKLDRYRDWYNEHRVHAALGVRTPNEVLGRVEPPKPMAIRSRDRHDVSIHITRRSCRGDPRLPILTLAVRLNRAA